jgi:phage terminase small subunit
MSRKQRLKDRQETFCINYFKTGNAAQSAVLAGYSVKAVRSIASRLLTFANIKARLAELHKRAEDASVMSVLERKQRLTEIARARLSDFVQCQDGRSRITVDLDSVNSAALEEVTSEEVIFGKGEGAPAAVVTKLKLRNPVSAIAELNKMEHIYDDSAKVNVNIDQRQLVIQVVDTETQNLLNRVKNGDTNLETNIDISR